MKTFSPATVRWVFCTVASGLAAMTLASWASAATENGSLGVSASLVHQCAVGTAALALGTLTVVNTNGTMATITGGNTVGIPWGCTNGTEATLSFGSGANSSGADRRMVSGSAGASNQYLEYQLKAGSSAGAPIGTAPVTLTGADGTNKTFTVWGGPVNSATNRSAKPADDYTDTVLLTITFVP
jgi:spore coat protein U-like protein